VTPFRVGIIGCGWVAKNRHVPAYRRLKDVKIAAVYDRRPDRAVDLARRIRARSFSGELEEMFRTERLDAVSVCTPPWLHLPQTLAALEAGVHVLTEKPMAMTESECRTMCQAAERKGLRLAVSHNFLFCRSVSGIVARIREGRSGKIRGFLGFQMSTPRRRLPDWYDRLPGQLFFDESPHLVYLAQKFTGPGDLAVAHAEARADSDGIQKTNHVVAVLDGGTTLGTISMTFNASRAEWGCVVIGSRESYLVDLFRDQVLVLGQGGSHSPGEVLSQTISGLAQGVVGAASSGVRLASGRLLFGHDVLISEFVRSAAEGGSVPVAGEEGRRTIAVLEAICKAAQLVPDEHRVIVPEQEVLR
jgi:scyllo-inositol 2-dehydrogenase (NADP+)